MNKILVIGNSQMNLVINMLRMPAVGETLNDDAGVGMIPGGRAAGIALALAKLGTQSVLCTKVGADQYGQKLYEYYKTSGIDTSAIAVDSTFPTGLSVVMREADGGERTVFYPGASGQLSSENMIRAFEMAPDAVLLNFDTPFTTAVTAAKIAAAKSIPVIFDASPATKEQPLETLPPVEIFSPNEKETEIYTGILPGGSDSSLRAAHALFRRVNCRYVVIKLGDRGACIYDGRHMKIISPKQVLRKTGSGGGDAFQAALAAEYIRTRDIIRSVEYAVAAGALSLSGGHSYMPTDAEIRNFLAKNA